MSIDASEQPTEGQDLALDVEDPDYILAKMSAPLGRLACLMLQTRVGSPSPTKSALEEALELARPLAAFPAFEELWTVLCADLEGGGGGNGGNSGGGGAKRALFAEDGPDCAIVDGTAGQPMSVAEGAAAVPEALSLDELHAAVLALVQAERNVAPPCVDPFAVPDGVPHARCHAAKLVSGWSQQEVEAALPLLSLQVQDLQGEVPDAFFPLPQALYRHTQRLPLLHARLDPASLAHMLAVAEQLVAIDPDRNAATERALLCLRGSVTRLSVAADATASVVAVVAGGAGQCPVAPFDPHPCVEDCDVLAATPLWQTPAATVPAATATEDAVMARSLQWRAALMGLGLQNATWAQAYVAQLPPEDDDVDPLLGFAVASALHPLPAAFVQALLAQCSEAVQRTSGPPPSLVRAYALVCCLLRLPSPLAAALPWLRQWHALVAAQRFVPAVLRQAMAVVLEGLAPTPRRLSSPMEAHEHVDDIIRRCLKQSAVRTRSLYCDAAPALLLQQLSPDLALSLLISQLVRVVRSDLDVSVVAHIFLRVVPALEAPCSVHVYLPSLVVDLADRPLLCAALVAFIAFTVLCSATVRADAGRVPQYRLLAHHLAHTMHATPHAVQLLRVALHESGEHLEGAGETARLMLAELRALHARLLEK